MLFTRWRALHTWKTYSKRNGSHSYRNVHDENPFKRNGSHSYMNVHDEDPFKKKW